MKKQRPEQGLGSDTYWRHQWIRWVSIFFLAEASAIALSVGVTHQDFFEVFKGINFAFAAAAYLVYDHEARGKGK